MKYLHILKLADDFESRLKEQIEKEKNISFEEAYLLSLGAIPIGTGSLDQGMSYLGEGFFSKAYRVIFNGKPAVAKITYSKEDIEAIEKLNAIKSSLPNDVQKHIIKIYKIKYADNSLISEKFKSLPIKERGFKQPVKIPHVAIVEELEPLSSDMINNIFTYYNSSNEEIKKENEKYNLIINNVKNNLKFLKSFVRGILLSDKQEFKDFLFDNNNFLILLNKTSEIINSYNYPKNYINFKKELPNISDIIKDLIKIILNYQGIENKNLIDLYAQECREKFYMFFNEIKTGLFPKSYRDSSSKLKIEILRSYPEVKSLVKLLDILKEKYNIKFIDLHVNNIMQRKNKDIVISDPGLFEFG